MALLGVMAAIGKAKCDLRELTPSSPASRLKAVRQDSTQISRLAGSGGVPPSRVGFGGGRSNALRVGA